MGQYRVYGTLKQYEIDRLIETMPDVDITVETDPGQTVETYISSKQYNDKTVEHAVKQAMKPQHSHHKHEPLKGVDLGKINLKKFIDESSSRNHVESFQRFESIRESVLNEKKKIDQDGDGDTDFIDAKIAQYMKGGMSKAQAIAKAKAFAKKNNIKEGLFNRWFKPSVDQAAHDSLRGQGHSHRGKEEEKEYIMHNGEKYYEDDIEYDDYNSTKPIPRVENGKLIIANPNWSNE